ncbi:hypothetical protein C1646_756743 [Rhizophagus diaphanus]|nr:hypothetical protein C1646_773642 [Rhizophagus diaphanus] [Rhizophagus sp. MUCL 43196]RGB37510.1 hypothetical protein C1646_756743 [Rhizophagus diaphanus] [Rhizophagus sp. MUCL 43196]
MSHDRKACFVHQPYFFKHKIYNFIKSSNKVDILTKQLACNNKKEHANLLFKRWRSHNRNFIHSHHLGISYQSQYYANGSTSKFNKIKRPMYRKGFWNLQFVPSSNSRTRKKQEKQFIRVCNRVFNHGKPNAAISVDDKLSAARRYRFLFVPSQCIDKPIQHLCYRKDEPIPDASKYNFLVPLPRTLSSIENSLKETTNLKAHEKGDRVRDQEERLRENENIWRANVIKDYNPFPPSDIYIHPTYRKYIPTTPLFKKIPPPRIAYEFHLPGSESWFKSIRDKCRHYDPKAYNKAIDEERERNNLIKQQILATELSTSVKRVYRRQSEMDYITSQTTKFHERMHILNNRLKPHKPKAVIDAAREEITKLSINFNETIREYYAEKELYESDTSYDTARIENRPYKRDTSSITNTYIFKQTRPSKHSRLSEKDVYNAPSLR